MNINDFSAEKMHRMCLRKKAYFTKAFAEKMAKKYTEKFGKQHYVYHCRLCGHFHLTTSDKKYEQSDRTE